MSVLYVARVALVSPICSKMIHRKLPVAFLHFHTHVASMLNCMLSRAQEKLEIMKHRVLCPQLKMCMKGPPHITDHIHYR